MFDLLKKILFIYFAASSFLMSASHSEESKAWYKIKKIDDLKIKVFFSDFELSIKHLYFFHLKLMSEYTKADEELNIYVYKGLDSRSEKRALAIKKYVLQEYSVDDSKVYIVTDYSKETGYILDGERVEVFMTRKPLSEIEEEIAARKNNKEATVVAQKKDFDTSKRSTILPYKKNYNEEVGYGESAKDNKYDEEEEVFLGGENNNDENGLESTDRLKKSTGGQLSGGGKFISAGGESGSNSRRDSNNQNKEVYLERQPSSEEITLESSASSGSKISKIIKDDKSIRLQVGTLGRLSKYNEIRDTFGAGIYSKLTTNNQSKLKFIFEGSFVGAGDTDWSPESRLSIGMESIFSSAEVSTSLFYKTSFAQNNLTFDFREYEDLGLSQEIRFKLFRNGEALYKISAFADFSFSNNLSAFSNSNILTYGFRTEALFKSNYLVSLLYEKRQLRDIGDFGTSSDHFIFIFSYVY